MKRLPRLGAQDDIAVFLIQWETQKCMLGSPQADLKVLFEIKSTYCHKSVHAFTDLNVRVQVHVENAHSHW